jgi:hypothetical protein
LNAAGVAVLDFQPKRPKPPPFERGERPRISGGWADDTRRKIER